MRLDPGTAAGRRAFRRFRPRRLWQAIWHGRRPIIRPFVVLLALFLIALVPGLIRYLQDAPKVEPDFETIVAPGAGPVTDFHLNDAHGRVHTSAAWADRAAIVLIFIPADRAVSLGLVTKISSWSDLFGPRGVSFFAVDSAPADRVVVDASDASRDALPFPVLLDREQRLARQAGARGVLEAVVLAPDGQILFRSEIEEQLDGAPQDGPSPTIPPLAAALASILRDEMPGYSSGRSQSQPVERREPLEQGSSVQGGTVTFTKDVAPILWRNCGRCHRPGQVAPFSLLSFRDAAKRADFIVEVTSANRMPPWKPHPGAGVFLDAARLSVLEKETLRQWAASGCAAGDPADLPAQPSYRDGWQLGQPNVILTMPEAYEVPPDGPDIYRSFCLGIPFEEGAAITAIEFRPGNERVVHHSRTYVDETGDARNRDRSDPQPGYTVKSGFAGSMELPYPGLGAWTPGMNPRFAPDGVGRLIPAGADIVLQVHYHPTGKRERDQSQVGLFISRKPITRTMAGYSLCTDQLDIPPGVNRHRVLLSTRLKADIHLYSVVPHAHYLCREFRLAATLPDGTTQPLLWISDWDFDWQDQYHYAKPVRLPKGTVVTLAAYFDNTAVNPRNPNRPPRRVRWGNSTKEEMCACHLEFMPDDPSGYKAYPLKSPFGL
jgi:hypothetical protein